MLLSASLVLVLVLVRAREERPMVASLALFSGALGVVTFQQTALVGLLLPFSLPAMRAARDASAFIFPAAFAAFVGLTVPARGRWPFFVAAGFAVMLLVALALDATAVVNLRLGAHAAATATTATVIALLAHLAFSARRHLAARKLLAGFSITFVFAMPDLLWGMGFQVLDVNVAHWGVLPLIGSMALVLQDRFRLDAEATRRRLKDIEVLNEELRFQVESRSRELRSMLTSGETTPLGMRGCQPGEVVGDRYKVEALLGRGGMGEVYRVERLSDGAHLALKLLTGDITRTDAARFAREAELAARIRHPNLVPVVDVGLAPGGPLYLVMELVDGSSVDQSRKRFGELDFGLRVLRDVARGLAAVHAAGVVHRDLKPSNVLLAGEVARLADFGVARPDLELELPSDVAEDKTLRPVVDARLTRTGAVVGTPMYMAPEVARGQPATRASDIFSLGLMGFELLTGKYPLAAPPFVAQRHGAPLVRVVADDALPPALRDVLGRALSENPAERPTADELLARLG